MTLERKRGNSDGIFADCSRRTAAELDPYLTTALRSRLSDEALIVKRYRDDGNNADVIEVWKGPWFVAECIRDLERKIAEHGGLTLDVETAVTAGGRLLYAEQTGR